MRIFSETLFISIFFHLTILFLVFSNSKDKKAPYLKVQKGLQVELISQKKKIGKKKVRESHLSRGHSTRAKAPDGIVFTYPWIAKRRNLEGVVKAQLKIDKDGFVLASKILKSSGSSILDKSALDQLKRIRFQPATVENKNIESQIEFDVIFKLED